MELRWDCTMLVYRGRLCNNVHLEKETELMEECLDGEPILRIVGGRYNGWYFALDDAWVRAYVQPTAQAA